MLILLSLPIILLLFIFLHNLIKYIFLLLKKSENMSLEVRLFSVTIVVLYLVFVLICVRRNIKRLGYRIDLAALYLNMSKLYIHFLEELQSINKITIIYVLSIIIVLCIYLLIILLIIILSISKYIRLCFKRLHYLFLNNEFYREYIVFIEQLYSRFNLTYINNIFAIKTINIIFRILFFLPLILIILSVVYDCFYNNYILEKYFYICCCLPMYYLIINVLSFLTQDIALRADDIVVYAAIYCKDSMYITKEIKDELIKYQYDGNKNRFDSRRLKIVNSIYFKYYTSLGEDRYFRCVTFFHKIFKKKKN